MLNKKRQGYRRVVSRRRNTIGRRFSQESAPELRFSAHRARHRIDGKCTKMARALWLCGACATKCWRGQPGEPSRYFRNVVLL